MISKINYLQFHCFKKLVNAHKHLKIIIFLLLSYNAKAQEIWSLQQCIDTAYVYNKSILISKNQISISEQKEKEIIANFIPKVGINADYKYFTELPHQLMPLNIFNPKIPEGQFKEVQFGVPHSINANVQVTLPIVNPQLFGAIKISKVAEEVTVLQSDKIQEQVAVDVSTLYYNAQVLKNQLLFIDSNLINTAKVLQNAELLYSQLMIKKTDVDKIKLQQQQLITYQLSVQNKLFQLLSNLKIMMGISLEKNIDIENIIFPQTIETYSSKETPDQSLIKIQNKLISNELSSLRQTQFMPSLNLIASYGSNGFGYDKKPNNFLKFYPIGFGGVMFNYPLFNGTATQRKINQKKLELKNNELQQKILFDQVNLQTENAVRQRNVSKKFIETIREQLNLSNKLYSQTLLQLKEGTASLTDVLLADNACREIQQNYLSAVIDYLKADLELKKITGNILKNK